MITYSGRVTLSGAISIGAPSSVVPTTGLKLWVDAAQNVTLDGSSRVSSLVELAQGLTFSQASAGSRLAVTSSAINGLPALTADATPRFLTSAAQTSVTDYTLFAVIKGGSSTAWFSKGTSSVAIELYIASTGSLTIAEASFDMTGAAQHTIQGCQFTHTGLVAAYQIVCVTKRGCHVKLFVNGVIKAQTVGSNPSYISPLNQAYTLMGQNGVGVINFNLAEMCFWDRRLSVGECNQVDAYLTSKFGIATTPGYTITDLPCIFCIGDSITAGIGASTTWPKRLVDDGTVGLNHVSRVYDYGNMGWAGRQASDFLTALSTEITPYLNNGDYVCWAPGTNDIFLGQTATQLMATDDSVYAALSAAATVKIIPLTILNRGNFTATMGSIDGAESGYQATVNARRRALVGSSVYACADPQAVVNLQTTSTAPNTYYQSGGVHPTNAGLNDEGDTVIPKFP